MFVILFRLFDAPEQCLSTNCYLMKLWFDRENLFVSYDYKRDSFRNIIQFDLIDFKIYLSKRWKKIVNVNKFQEENFYVFLSFE